jgi:putative sterol carrier protein
MQFFRQDLSMQSFLQDSFAPEAAADLETDIELRFPDTSTFCDVRGGVLSFPQITNAELVLYFESQDQAKRLFRGQEDVVEAFMHGHIRSNGHLIWVFKTFAAFSKGRTAA